VRARGLGVRRLCHGRELAPGARPKRTRAERRWCCVAGQVNGCNMLTADRNADIVIASSSPAKDCANSYFRS
jgi:hypothetical protein